MKKPKRGERYLNYLGEYCVIKSTYSDIIKIQICGDKARTEPWRLEDFLKQKDKFWIIPYPRITRENIARHLLEYQLNMIGKTTIQTRSVDEWYSKWTISKIEFQFFENYAIPLLRKTFKINKQKAEKIFNWFDMQFGLKRK